MEERIRNSALNAALNLREMVAIPSFSGEEEKVSQFLAEILEGDGVNVNKVGNNFWALACEYNSSKPTLMLNSHMDTVRPASSYSFDPYNPPQDELMVKGLGSNDAGASVVCLIEVLKILRSTPLPFNLLLAITAEEENSGPKGMKMLYPNLPPIDCAIIGEPTKMEAAIAERGLLVIDAISNGISGHAAREEGVNAILIAHRDISKILSYKFDKISPVMGSVKVSVTKIEAGREHNVIPDKCCFTMDIRPNEMYSNEEIFNKLQELLESNLKARSFSNKCSMTPNDHELIKCAERCGIVQYVSPTTSDWMRVSVPAIKMGPGDSSRSHKADEYVTKEELSSGIEKYLKFINNLNIKR
jgi:acetylornithine deacetylase